MRQSDLIKRMVSVSRLSQGQAPRILKRLEDEPDIVLLKNNQPVAVIVSTELFDCCCAMAEECSALADNDALPEETRERLRQVVKKSKLFATD